MSIHDQNVSPDHSGSGTVDDLAAAVGREAAKELASAVGKIKHCLGQLTDEQVWWRSHPSLNSIGNLILHLCGNLRQWIVAGLPKAKDVRDRPAEFAERGPISKDGLESRSLGGAEYRRLLSAVDLFVSDEYEDEGQNHYFDAAKFASRRK
jgi:hypothetical protein